jgi:hypothetical protein
MTGIKCDYCGSVIHREIRWCDLTKFQNMFCDPECMMKFRKEGRYHQDADSVLTNLLGIGGNYRDVAPKRCQRNGIKKCTECPYKKCIEGGN